jgi:hypothetical protein
MPRIFRRGPDWAAIEAEETARADQISAELEAERAEVYFDSLEEARAAAGFGSLKEAQAWVRTQIEVDALETVETPADLLPEPEAEP